jgi:hypothetical protein
MVPVPHPQRVARIARLLGAAQCVVAVGVGIAPTSEGWAGGVLYALMYAAPLFVLAWILEHRAGGLRKAAGVIALVMAVYMTAVPIGNWSGYAALQAVFVVAITVPTVLVLIAIGIAALARNADPEKEKGPAERGLS